MKLDLQISTFHTELLSVMVKKYSLINPNGSNTSLASNEAFLSGETVACVKLQKNLHEIKMYDFKIDNWDE